MKGLARNPESAFAPDPWAKPASVPVPGSPDILELSRRSERSTDVEITLIFQHRLTKLVQNLIETTIYRLKTDNAGSLRKLS